MSKKYTTSFKDKRANNFKKLISEKIAFKRLIYISLALNVLNLLMISLLQRHLPPQVPLFYGMAEGEEQLTTSFGLLIPGSLSILIILINGLLSLLLESKFLQKTLSAVSFTVSLLSAITVTKIVLLIGNI